MAIEHGAAEKIDEQYRSKIELRFFRHSKKESSGHGHQVKLSPEGRMLAKEKSPAEININQAIAFASPRVRAQETAGFVLAGSQDVITGDESLAELKEKLDASLERGSKLGIDSRLDFTDDQETPYGKMLKDAEARGEYTKFVIEESDRVAKEMKGTSGATYSVKSAKIASLVKKYLTIAPRWDELVQDRSKNYAATLERYFSTHAGNCESFLAKLIEKTDGLESRARFIEAIGKQGFHYVEGFEADILTGADGSRVLQIRFTSKDGGYRFDKIVPPTLLDEIIQEGEVAG